MKVGVPTSTGMLQLYSCTGTGTGTVHIHTVQRSTQSPEGCHACEIHVHVHVPGPMSKISDVCRVGVSFTSCNACIRASGKDWRARGFCRESRDAPTDRPYYHIIQYRRLYTVYCRNSYTLQSSKYMYVVCSTAV